MSTICKQVFHTVKPEYENALHKSWCASSLLSPSVQQYHMV